MPVAAATPIELIQGVYATLDERVAALDLVSHEFEPWEEVIDPGAGEQPVFDACIDELSELIDGLATVLEDLTR